MHRSPGNPAEAVEALVAQARAAEASGFDGVTLSEHHQGFPGYFPTPTLLAGHLLARTDRIWSAPCPTILPLRSTVAVVEQLAWLAACHPGRVGAGFVPGYQPADFDLLGADFDRRRGEFAHALPEVVAALAGSPDGPLAADPAVRALAGRPVPVVSGVGGVGTARLAARAGAGLLVTSLTPVARARALFAAHRAEGGTGPRVLVRRAWLGPLPASAGEQLAAYRRADPDGTIVAGEADEVVIAGTGPDVADQLVSEIQEAEADAVNLRLYVPDADPRTLEAQVGGVGAEVLPVVRRRLGWTLHNRGRHQPSARPLDH